MQSTASVYVEFNISTCGSLEPLQCSTLGIFLNLKKVRPYPCIKSRNDTAHTRKHDFSKEANPPLMYAWTVCVVAVENNAPNQLLGKLTVETITSSVTSCHVTIRRISRPCVFWSMKTQDFPSSQLPSRQDLVGSFLIIEKRSMTGWKSSLLHTYSVWLALHGHTVVMAITVTECGISDEDPK